MEESLFERIFSDKPAVYILATIFVTFAIMIVYYSIFRDDD